jgi:hypothetical protein
MPSSGASLPLTEGAIIEKLTQEIGLFVDVLHIEGCPLEEIQEAGTPLKDIVLPNLHGERVTTSTKQETSLMAKVMIFPKV